MLMPSKALTCFSVCHTSICVCLIITPLQQRLQSIELSLPAAMLYGGMNDALRFFPSDVCCLFHFLSICVKTGEMWKRKQKGKAGKKRKKRPWRTSIFTLIFCFFVLFYKDSILELLAETKSTLTYVDVILGKEYMVGWSESHSLGHTWSFIHHF